MGKLLIFLKYIFFIFSSDINENRRHIHVTDKKSDLERICKFWIEPYIELEYNMGFTNKEIHEIKRMVISNMVVIQLQLDIFYTHKKVKPINKNE